MAMQDGPLKKQPSALQDGPLPKPQEVKYSEDTPLRDQRMAQAAVLQSEKDGSSVLEKFASLSESKRMSGDAARMQAATELHDDIMVDARELFYSQALDQGTLPEDALAGLSAMEAREEEGKAREIFPIKQYVSAIADPSLSTEDRETLATGLYLQDKLHEITQGISGWDSVRDIGLSVLIGPKDLYDAWQLTGAVSPWEQENQYRKFAAWFQGLPNDQKIEMWPAITEYFVDAMPEGRAVDFLQGLIDPAQVEANASELSVWGSIDAALLGAGTVATAFKLRKLFNPLKAATRAGDTERAADTNLALMESPGAGNSLDLDDWQVNTNALPFLGENLDDAVASELSPAVHERIFQFRDRMKQQFTDLSEARTFAREGFLDEADRARAESRLYDEYEAYVRHQYSANDKIVNLDVREETTDGLNFHFTVTNPDGTEVKDTFRGKFNFDDIGFWTSTPKDSVFFSELAQANKTDFMSTVKAAIRLDNTAASIASQLRATIKDASKPIKGRTGKPRKQKIEEVDSVLIAGDDMDKEFTPRELRAGVNGIKLDEDQIEYYYNMRGVMNGLGILRNMDSRRAMDARGVKNIFVNDTTQLFGTPVDDAAAAASRVKDIRKVWKFGPDGGMAVNVNELRMADEYAEGYRLVRLEEDTILGGQRFQHVMVKTDTMSDLPAVVLDLKKGYIPRLNPNATYFVQRFTKSSLDGVDDVTRKAVRSFDNKADADAFASRMYAEAGDADNVSFHVVSDGELEAFKAGESGSTQVGGLVYSPRARKPVPHNDGDSTTVPRTSALEAIELYLENTKNYMSRNDWRMGLRKKWENTAKFKLGKTVTFEEGENIANKELNTLWKKINQYSGFMDKSERAWEETVKSAYEWSVEKFGRNRMSDFILTQRQKDPLARFRSATFHTLLGFFNPVQLWVQAQGAAVAASMNLSKPQVLQRLFRQQGALTMLQHVHFDDSPETLRKMAKSFGYKDVDELKATAEIWKKSGLYDSVLSSADVEAAARGFPTTKNGLKRFFDSGLLFFRAGELFNRRLAFLTAIEELGGAAKVQASDKLFKEALDRTNGLILNLGKANRASWQKGFLSIPTQFMQIQAKTIESVLGMNGVFKKSESAKMLMSQMALYGSAGVFGGPWALNFAADQMGIDRIDINNMDPATLRAVTGGFTDWFAYQLGANIVASDRGALLNGMDQTMFSLFTEEMTAFQWLAGPSSVGPERVWSKMRQLSSMFPIPQDINGNVSFSAQDVTDTLQFIVKGGAAVATSPFASTSQVEKYMLMRDLGQIRDTNGNIVAAPQDGFNWQTEWAALAGFKPELLQRKFDLSEINEATRKYVEFRTQMLVQNWDDFLMEYNRALEDNREMDEDVIRQLRKRHNVLLNAVSDPGVRRKILDSYGHKIRNRGVGDSQLDRQMQTYYENMLLDIHGTFTSSSTRMIQTRDTEE